jgi:dipeptidase D
MYGRKAEVTAMHAGLECGIFDEIFDGKMDMISLGPDTYEFHTPQEHLSISSVERTWEFLQEVLKGIR